MKIGFLTAVFCGVAAAQQPGTFAPTGQMTTPRANHTATLLFDGKVLITGGDNYAGSTEQLRVNTAEVYDPGARTFAWVGNMTTGRSGHTATLLPDGRVLIAGGDGVIPWGSDPSIPGTAEVYDPSTQTFSATGSMITGRTNANATLLPNGKVLITGGIARYDNDDDTVLVGGAEEYDALTGTFSSTGPYAGSLSRKASSEWFDSTSTRLSDGTVLFATEPAAEVFDSTTGSFSLRGSMVSHAGLPYLLGRTASLLMNGRVLLAGGEQEDTGRFNNAELYDPTTGVFSATGAMTVARDGHTSTLLPDGTVLVAGGQSNICLGNECYFAGSENSAEMFDPAQGAFMSAGIMTQRRDSHTATLLNNGDVLLAGGNVWGGIALLYGSYATAELYHPASTMPPPMLFSLIGDGEGQGAIWNATTGLVPTAFNPARAGDILSTYTTGLREGAVLPPQVIVGERLADVLFFGDAPGYQGYNQVNFRVPGGVTPGVAVPVRLTYLGRASNAVMIGVQ